MNRFEELTLLLAKRLLEEKRNDSPVNHIELIASAKRIAEALVADRFVTGVWGHEDDFTEEQLARFKQELFGDDSTRDLVDEFLSDDHYEQLFEEVLNYPEDSQAESEKAARAFPYSDEELDAALEEAKIYDDAELDAPGTPVIRYPERAPRLELDPELAKKNAPKWAQL